MFMHERIQQKLDEKNLKQADIARATGKSTAAVTKWVHGDSKPKAETLKVIANFLEVSDDWLLTGKESNSFKPLSINEIKQRFGSSNSNAIDISTGIGVYEDGDPIPEGFVAIDYYPEIKASAGNGYINLEDSSPYKMFIPTADVARFGASPNHSKIFKVDGESMVPDLYPDQKISVDTSAKKIYDGEIYAFTKGSELKIKILFNWGQEGLGGFKAVSRNPDKVRYPDEYYSPVQIESEHIQVIGQYWLKIDGRKVRR